MRRVCIVCVYSAHSFILELPPLLQKTLRQFSSKYRHKRTSRKWRWENSVKKGNTTEKKVRGEEKKLNSLWSSTAQRVCIEFVTIAASALKGICPRALVTRDKETDREILCLYGVSVIQQFFVISNWSISFWWVLSSPCGNSRLVGFFILPFRYGEVCVTIWGPSRWIPICTDKITVKTRSEAWRSGEESQG